MIQGDGVAARRGAEKRSWKVISMKNDWKRIFAFDKWRVARDKGRGLGFGFLVSGVRYGVAWLE